MIYQDMIADEILDFMTKEEKALILGVGVSDPKGIFGTTLLSSQNFPSRVMETPLSENALTGACVGLSLEGYTPILVHARTDFLTLSAEHIINTAAKWNMTHNSDSMGRVIIRAIQGRGWGQGPQHSQNLGTMFLNVPGVSVWMPVTERAYFNALHQTDSPVTIIIEPRRLFSRECHIDNKAGLSNTEIIYTFGDTIIDAVEAAKIISDKYHITVDICPIERVDAPWPIRWPSAKNVIICENSSRQFGLSSELAFNLAYAGNIVKRLSPPHIPCATSLPLEEDWYIKPIDIVNAFAELHDYPLLDSNADTEEPLFTGPF